MAVRLSPQKGWTKEAFASCAWRLVGLLLLIAALWVLSRALGGLHLSQIGQALRGLPGNALGAAFLLTGMNYFVLTWHDWLALKYVKRDLAYPKVSLAAFLSYALSNGLGFGTITGSSVRFRLYWNWGLKGVEITKIVSFCILTMGLGLSAAAGISFLAHSRLVASQGAISLLAVRITGALLLCLVAAYLLLCAFHRRRFLIRSWDFSLPPFPLAIAQVLASSLDWACAGSVLYVLMPAGSAVTYFQFMSVFLLAQAAGIASQVPAGLGVLESVVVMFLVPAVPAQAVVASILVYRAVYYVLPLIIAAPALGLFEALNRREQIARPE